MTADLGSGLETYHLGNPIFYDSLEEAEGVVYHFDHQDLEIHEVEVTKTIKFKENF